MRRRRCCFKCANVTQKSFESGRATNTLMELRAEEDMAPDEGADTADKLADESVAVA